MAKKCDNGGRTDNAKKRTNTGGSAKNKPKWIESKGAKKTEKGFTKDDGYYLFTDSGTLKKPRIATQNVTVEGQTYRIPVNDKGYVEEWALALRFADVCSGDRDSRKRDQGRDLDKTAVKTYRLTDRTRPKDIAEWWAHPNESDIIGIDDETTKIFSTEGAYRKSSLRYQRKIGIVGTPDERKAVRKTLDSSFTTSELKTLTENGCVYVFAYGGRKNLDEEGKTMGYYNPNDGEIVIRKGDLDYRKGTIVHETVHKLRRDDKTRTGVWATSKIDETRGMPEGKKLNHIQAVEEGCTELETTARLSPYKTNGNRVSYYGELSKDPDERKRLRNEDRKLMVGNADPDRKGIKGKKVVAAVNALFTKSNISGIDRGSGKKARAYRKQ